MKKYIKVMPMILFPYLFVLLTIFLNEVHLEISGRILLYTLLFMYVASVIIYNVNAIRGKYSATEAAWINLWVRVGLIPIYVLVFVFACMGLLLGPFAMGAIALAFVFDVILIFCTSIATFGCNVALGKGRVFPKVVCFLFWILNFVFCIDVIMAIVYVFSAKRAQKNSK